MVIFAEEPIPLSIKITKLPLKPRQQYFVMYLESLYFCDMYFCFFFLYEGFRFFSNFKCIFTKPLHQWYYNSRISILNEQISSNIYKIICRAIFVDHVYKIIHFRTIAYSSRTLIDNYKVNLTIWHPMLNDDNGNS